MTYDRVNNLAVLFGGRDDSGIIGDTWILETSDYIEEGSYTSPLISLPENKKWDTLSINALQPNGTEFSVSLIDGETGLFIPRFRDMEVSDVDISSLRTSSIKLRGNFKRTYGPTPVLGSWGVEWGSENTWKDSFIGDGKLNSSSYNYRASGSKLVMNNTDLASAVVRSETITLPDNSEWDRAVINRDVPTNTYLSVSVHDAETDDELESDDGTDARVEFDLSDDESVKSIYFKATLQPSDTNSPALLDWAVSWNPLPLPVFAGPIEDIILSEDTPENGVLNISHYFSNTTGPSVQYSFESISNTDNITVEISGSDLDVTYLEDNWTGKVDIVIKCAHAEGRSAQTNRFSIIVESVDDPPVWIEELPPITMDEDGTYISPYKILDHLHDAEGNTLGITAISENKDVKLTVDADFRLGIIPAEDFHGSTEITITATELINSDKKAETTVPLTVRPVNDDPEISLLSPGNNAVVNELNLTLSWEIYDVETPSADLTCELYFGEGDEPDLYTSDIEGKNFTVRDLKDKTTYYWAVKVKDAEGEENTTVIWSFKTDTESEPIPGSTGDNGNLSVSVAVKSITAKQGETTTFDVNISNKNEKDISVGVVAAGAVAPYIDMDNIVSVPGRDTATVTASVLPDHSISPGNYTAVLLFISPANVESVSIPLQVLEGEGDSTVPPEDGKDGTTTVAASENETGFYVIITVMIIVLILLAAGLMITFKQTRSLKRKMDKAEEKAGAGRDAEVVETDQYFPAKRYSFVPQTRREQQSISDQGEVGKVPMSQPPVPPDIQVKLPDTPSSQRELTERTENPPNVQQTTGQQPQAPQPEGQTPTPQTQPSVESQAVPTQPMVQLPPGGTGQNPGEGVKKLPENTTPPPPA